MSKNNKPVDPKVGIIPIIIFSIIPSFFAGVLVYYSFIYYIAFYSLDIHTLNQYYSYICAILSYFLSVYIGITYGRIFYSRTRNKSLTNFRAFTDELNTGSTEKAVYQTLHEYIARIYKKTKVSIIFKNNMIVEKSPWEFIPSNVMPLCNMNPRYCPVTSQSKECFVNDIQTELTCAFQLSNYKVGSYVCLLFKMEAEPLAVIQLYSQEKNYFDVDTVKELRSYIDIIKPIIKNRNQMTDLNMEAFTDSLTRAKNRTFFEQEISMYLDTSESLNEPLSLIMLDIDFFKKVNDTYGHPAGDCVLIEFANIVLQCIRSTDLLIRYGGEEFIVLLPNSNPSYATSIAEKIRKSVASAKMPVFEGVQLSKISCSLGVSCFPDFASDKFTLIKTADIALYAAKHTGRNKVVTFDPYDETLVSQDID